MLHLLQELSHTTIFVVVFLIKSTCVFINDAILVLEKKGTLQTVVYRL